MHLRPFFAAANLVKKCCYDHALHAQQHRGCLSYPHRWHYNVLRGLAYFARIDAPRDQRLQDAIDWLHSRRHADGKWPVQHKFSGKTHFQMEKIGGPSRWNTLRALRVLRWWAAARGA
jgi:hypothetical protein